MLNKDYADTLYDLVKPDWAALLYAFFSNFIASSFLSLVLLLESWRFDCII